MAKTKKRAIKLTGVRYVGLGRPQKSPHWRDYEIYM